MTNDPLQTTEDCCDVWPEIRDSFAWFQLQDAKGVYMMPCIEDIELDPRWRVNFCPSCGKTRRMVVWNTNND
jgi:hypothetical protein